jgi:pimeloyl-ACP methyl ester carboxylesterase
MLAHLPGWQAEGVDLPGHGEAPDWDGTTDYGDAAFARAEAALGQGADVLVGHSFGAVTALRLALAHAGAVGRLVLIEPVLFAAARGTPAWDANAADFAPYLAAMAAGDRAAAARAFLALWGDGTAWEALPPPVRAGFEARIHLIAAGGPTLEDDRAGLLAPGRLEGLAIPVTLVEGGDSPPVIAAIHAALAARLPFARREVVPGARHMLPVTHAAEVAAALA